MAAKLGLLLLIIVSMATGAEVNDDVKSLATASADMGLNLYRKLSETEDSPNLFLSPYSIATALTLIYQGANGQTKTEMSDVLGYSGRSEANLNGDYQTMSAAIAEDNKDYSLNIANRLYGQSQTKFLDTFLNPLEQYYNAPLEQKDFVTQTEQARQDINQWVADQTAQKIKELLPAGSIDASTRLVLVNAIYFKGNWAEQFDREKTQEELFYTSSDSNTLVPMMKMDSGSYKFFHDENMKAKIIRLPYEGDGDNKGQPKFDDIAMYIILPDESDGLAAIESSLTGEKLNNMITSMYFMTVKPVMIPRFNISEKYSLADTLSALGMKQAFQDTADLSGMTGERNLYVSSIYHEAVVEVNEEGTTAAAATGGIISLTSIQIPATFRADKPFLFFIREEDTGAVLFLGRYKDPKDVSMTDSAPRALMSWGLLLVVLAYIM